MISLASFGGVKTNESHVNILRNKDLTVLCTAVIIIMITKMTTMMIIIMMMMTTTMMTMMMMMMMMTMMTGWGKAGSEEFQLESDLSNDVD